MARKVVGPTGSRRRRWLFLCTAMAAIAMAVLVIPSAFAVHDTGVFQLEGDAQQSTPANTPGEDWDNVCAKYQAAGTAAGIDVCHKAAGVGALPSNTTAEASTFITDAFNASSDNIFKGGTDDANISTWQWKQATPSPNKADLEQAFAAQYTVPNDAPDAAGDQVLYFGGTRYSNNGDTNIGLWFFQHSVTTKGAHTNADGSCSVSSGCGFTGTHTVGNVSLGGSLHGSCVPGHITPVGNVCTPGDIFILSSFTGGGTQPTIKIFEWVGAGNATKDYNGSNNCFTNACTLQPLAVQPTPGFTDNRCAPSDAGVTGDVACAIVNSGQIQSPWLFTDQGGAPADQIAANELYEGGLDLTGLGFGGACFSSMLLNTRSSQSGTSVLQDFALGNFAPCGASVTTTPSAGTTDATSVSPGTPVTDTATVTGTGVANPPTPSGNVTFAYCGPTDPSSTATCDTGGTTIGSPVALDGTGQPQGTAVATSGQINTSGSPLTPGRYCFRATWPGDTNYQPTAPATVFVETNASSECFVVRTIPTTTTTTPWSASDATGQALGTGTLALGTTLFDKAVVQGTSVGGSPPGTVNFFLCNPGQVTGTAGSETCASGTGTALTGNPRTLVADTGSSPPTSTVFSSPGGAANKAGVGCFRAEYTHPGSTYQDSSDSSHNECVTVGPENTTTTTTPKFNGNNIVGALAVGSMVTDHAVVAAIDNADDTPTGTVDFFICDPSHLSSNGNCSSGGVSAGAGKALSALSGQSTPSATADSDAVTASSVGTWCFRAVYTPSGANGANYNGSQDPGASSTSKSECFLVQDSTSMTSAQSWVPNDTATVAATGGTALNGTIDIQMYLGTCNSTGSDLASGATAVVGQDYNTHITNATTAPQRTFSTSNSTAVIAGTQIAWLVTFTPDSGTNVTGSQHCENSSLTLNNH